MAATKRRRPGLAGLRLPACRPEDFLEDTLALSFALDGDMRLVMSWQRLVDRSHADTAF